MNASYRTSSVGIMDGAYFVGRQEILSWLNGFLGTNYAKVEHTANGAAVCQIFAALHPGSVALSRVNFDARQEYQFINNYKILQAAFAKLRIDKHIDVDRLTKGRYQDNLEFLQWVKAYFDRNSCGEEVVAKVQTRKPLPSSRSKMARTARSGPGARGPVPKPEKSGRHVSVTRVQGGSAQPASQTVSKMEYNILQNSLKELQLTVEELEKERDFYFGKLRDIEILCQTNEEHSVEKDNELLRDITAILYANDDDEQEDQELVHDTGANPELSPVEDENDDDY